MGSDILIQQMSVNVSKLTGIIAHLKLSFKDKSPYVLVELYKYCPLFMFVTVIEIGIPIML